jgi:hypothetical protein
VRAFGTRGDGRSLSGCGIGPSLVIETSFGARSAALPWRQDVITEPLVGDPVITGIG